MSQSLFERKTPLENYKEAKERKELRVGELTREEEEELRRQRREQQQNRQMKLEGGELSNTDSGIPNYDKQLVAGIGTQGGGRKAGATTCCCLVM